MAKMNPGDSRSRKSPTWYVAGAILLLSIVALLLPGVLRATGFSGGNELMLVISAKGQVVYRKPFKDVPEGIIPVTGPLGVTQVEVAGRKVHVLHSPCDNHICMNTGWIAQEGQIIVCMPNQVVVQLTK
ncbi:MAG TPA: NusG domain II-containing protein [Firmicutes bacterium]|nr:NusG domain II-containing protein [Candidatus Fermentithermobacillaceae bacterium]